MAWLNLIFFTIFSIIISVTIYASFTFSKVHPGKVIILDGTSTAGKTSILNQLMPLLGPTYEQIGIDDFVTEVFLKQKDLQLPEQEFLKQIRECSNNMWKTVRKFVDEGKNIIVDTVLLWFDDDQDVINTFDRLKDLNIILVLVYCPLPAIAERIRLRNKKAIAENKPEDIRYMIGNVKFDCTYQPLKSDKEIILDVLSHKDIEFAYQAPKEANAQEVMVYEQVKNRLLSHFGLDEKKSVNITTRLTYDCIVNSSKHMPQECAQQIFDCLKSTDMKAFLINQYLIKKHVNNDRYIKKNNIQLWVETFGNSQDPAILLISGAMAPARSWTDKFCNYLAHKGFFVIRYDHRDTGLSSSIDYSKNPYGLDDLVEDLIAILDTYKINKAHLIGHSVGGTLTQLFAVKYPYRCSSITIISGRTVEEPQLTEQEKEILAHTWEIFLANKPTLNYKESLDGFLRSYKYLNGTVEFDQEMAKAYVKDMYQRSKHIYLTKDNQIKAFEVPHNHVKAQETINITKNDLQKITTPTLIIHGQEDYIALPINAKITAQAIPGSKLVIIPGMGHMFFNRKLEKQIADHILNHIQEK